VRHLLMASTSSVYGANERTPFREEDKTDRPLTLYAATKKANEAMAHSYAHLWAIPTTMFRFFTVYGPWGRPDMAPLKFVEAIENGRTIDIYNHGKMERDFTYIDDLVEAIRRLIDVPPALGLAIPRHRRWRHTASSISGAANRESARLHRDRRTKLGKKAVRNYVDMQKGDAPRTLADSDLLMRLTGYRPSTSVADGVSALVDWYRDYHAKR